MPFGFGTWVLKANKWNGILHFRLAWSCPHPSVSRTIRARLLFYELSFKLLKYLVLGSYREIHILLSIYILVRNSCQRHYPPLKKYLKFQSHNFIIPYIFLGFKTITPYYIDLCFILVSGPTPSLD